jgi:hypothetical protein
MHCLKSQWTDHLIPKKFGGLKWMFQRNFQPAPYITRDFHPDPLAFNSILPRKKICNWGLIWALHGQIT